MTSQPYPSINIIGAGIAGLSLACHLRLRRIPFTIFDAASKPKGYNYGITISPRGYSDLLPALEPKLDIKAFREITAVDRFLGGTGVVSSSTANSKVSSDDFRASDLALREVLARGHNVKWNHKVVSAELESTGALKLNFENGKQSTADLTIDAGGERAALSALFLPGIKPEILPYAVYHGSRYIAASQAQDFALDEIFTDNEVVTSIPPQPTSSDSSAWHIQLSKSYIRSSNLPSKLKDSFANGSDNDDSIIELRYTFSRPSTSSSDPVFRPHRSRTEASTIPSAFYTEIQNCLSQSILQTHSVSSLLSPESLQSDRVLNWLLRLTALDRTHLQTLAMKRIIAIGDAVRATPPLGSEGASVAMVDASRVAEWIRTRYQGNNPSDSNEEQVSEQDIMACYDHTLVGGNSAREVLDAARGRIEGMHGLESVGRQEDTDGGKRDGKL